MSEKEIEQTVERTIDDLYRERGDVDLDAVDAEVYVRRDAMAAAKVLDECTFAELDEMTGFDTSVEGEFTPQDIAFAAYANWVTSREIMHRYTDLTPKEFVVLHDSLRDLRQEAEA